MLLANALRRANRFVKGPTIRGTFTNELLYGGLNKNLPSHLRMLV